jgi:hypothetical protein
MLKPKWLSDLSEEFFQLSFTDILIRKHLYRNILQTPIYNLKFMISKRQLTKCNNKETTGFTMDV